jgi:flagellar biosynthesis chaperone FliJ
MDEAQSAIDAARAAGAEQYVPAAYAAAVAALGEAKRAVEDRDYRLALSHALEAREEAQDAAEQAASQKVVVRREVEHTLDAVAADIEELDRRLAAARAARIPAPQMAQSHMTRSAVETAVQEARAALAQDDNVTARESAKGLSERVREAIGEIDAALAGRSPR